MRILIFTFFFFELLLMNLTQSNVRDYHRNFCIIRVLHRNINKKNQVTRLHLFRNEFSSVYLFGVRMRVVFRLEISRIVSILSQIITLYSRTEIAPIEEVGDPNMIRKFWNSNDILRDKIQLWGHFFKIIVHVVFELLNNKVALLYIGSYGAA